MRAAANIFLTMFLFSLAACSQSNGYMSDADRSDADTGASVGDDMAVDDAFATPEAPVADDDAAAIDETADIPDDTVLLDAEEALDDAVTAEDDLPAVDEAADEDAAVASKWPACDPYASQQTVSFVHVNDLHSTYQPGIDGKSKFSRIKGYYHKVRGENAFTVFTDGGDDYEKGAVAEQYSQGLTTRLITEFMGFDVRVIGNHDFAWSLDEVLAFSRIPGQMVVSSNMEWIGTPADAWGAVKWATLTVGCVKIGFFGFTSKPWNEKDQQYDGDFYPEVKALSYDYIALAKEIVAAHRHEVDIMAMLSHTGKGDDEAIAQAVGGIDVILGAHSHSSIMTKEVVNGTLIAQAGSNGDFACRVDMTVDLATRKVVDTGYAYQATQLLPVDAATEDFIGKTLDDHAPEWDQTVATVLGFPSKESIAGIAAKAAAQTLGAKAGIVQVSTVWDTWTTGGVTPQKMLDTFKVEREKPGTLGFNAMTLVSLTGADLALLRDTIDTGSWRLYIDGTIDPQEIYPVAFQKRGAYNAAEYFPGIAVTGVVEKREMWDILVEWGKKRQKECRYLDSDNKIPLCF